jgi:hypothetical protein
MLKAAKQSPYENPVDIRWIYNKYSAMLLGYIQGTLKNQHHSEKQLVKIFSSYMKEHSDYDVEKLTWLHLRQYAQKHLSQLNLKPQDSEVSITSAHPNNKVLELLNEAERRVFSEIYYHRKSINYLSGILSLPENEVRGLLKSSLDKIRNAHGN